MKIKNSLIILNIFEAYINIIFYNESQAGISKESLLICLEPEAAAIYCKWIQIERDDDALNVMKPGRRFLVLDAGGIEIMQIAL